MRQSYTYSCIEVRLDTTQIHTVFAEQCLHNLDERNMRRMELSMEICTHIRHYILVINIG